MNIKPIAVSILLFAIGVNQSKAIENKDLLGMWSMYFGTARLTDKWSIHSELQYRSFTVKPNIETLLPRFGINYHIDKNNIATFGFAPVTFYDIDKDKIGTATVSEKRLFQQYINRSNLGRVNFENRYRFEERFLADNQKETQSTRFRFRYLVRVSVPINKSKMEKGTVFYSIYDELFINGDNVKSTYFDRNRFYNAIGYQFSPLSNIQVGHMVQTVNTNSKNYLQVALFYNLDFRKKSS